MDNIQREDRVHVTNDLVTLKKAYTVQCGYYEDEFVKYMISNEMTANQKDKELTPATTAIFSRLVNRELGSACIHAYSS